MFAHLTLDGNSEYVAGMKKVGVFREKKIGFVDVPKYLQQIEIPDFLYMCAPWSEFQSNISTMRTN